MSVLLACAVCFQAEPNATTDGLRAAVLVLMGVTTAVLSGFGIFIFRIRGTLSPGPPDSLTRGGPVPRAVREAHSLRSFAGDQ